MEVTSSQVCEELLKLLSELKSHIGRLADDHGLTHIQLYALRVIGQQGELPMGYVATALHCDASNVTGIVDRLVSRGLLVRRESSQDRRAKVLRLTAKGDKLVKGIAEELPAKLGCARLSAAERTTFYKLMRKVAL